MGIKKGASGSDGFKLSLYGGGLHIDNCDDSKAYIIFPEADTPDSYTVYFTFAFTDVVSSNGYLAFMLSCDGDEPVNVTSASVRADGKCDGFGELGDEISTAISEGKDITVEIPVEKRTLHEITVRAENTAETLILENIVDVDQGNFGFIVRNASAVVKNVYLIDGTNHNPEELGQKIASLQQRSATDSTAGSADKSDEESAAIFAPQTSDSSLIPYTAYFAVAALLITLIILQKRKHKKAI